jgi:glycosyltransferase involved in cell wall biosynthesis
VRIVLDGQPLRGRRAGIGQYTRALVRALARVAPANEYALLYERPFPWVASLFRDGGGTAVRIVPPRGLGVASKLLQRLGLDLPVETLAGRFDVFHATNSVFPRPVRAGRRVVTVHDLTLLRFPEWHPPDRLDAMVPRLADAVRLADRVIADSEWTRQDLVTLLSVPADRVTVVPLAPDASFGPRERAEIAAALRPFGLRHGEYLLFVGTVEPRKNLARLLDAVELAGARVGVLVIAGERGWKSAELHDRMARLAGGGRVRYVGYVSDAARAVLMNGARAFVYPSLYEGFGLPPLEAMACGTPVLVSNAASLPEVVAGAALLVDPHDTGAIAAALDRLWNDEALRAGLRERGLARASRFSWETTALATLAVYREPDR